MPRDSGAAFVVVSESMDPIDTAALVAALDGERRAALPAGVARDGEALEPDRVYVRPIGAADHPRRPPPPPGQPRSSAPGHRGTVDTFLISLAEQQREAAVGHPLRRRCATPAASAWPG